MYAKVRNSKHGKDSSLYGQHLSNSSSILLDKKVKRPSSISVSQQLPTLLFLNYLLLWREFSTTLGKAKQVAREQTIAKRLIQHQVLKVQRHA